MCKKYLRQPVIQRRVFLLDRYLLALEVTYLFSRDRVLLQAVCETRKIMVKILRRFITKHTFFIQLYWSHPEFNDEIHIII